MRKGQRFTPARLRAWQLAGRGTGTGTDYQPWHQITRADPGSRGRSHLINWRLGRLHHLLSDHELLIMAFAAMVPGLTDLREQFPLSLETHSQELGTYRSDLVHRVSPGTRELAEQLGIRHPKVRAKGEVAWWIMTTDLLLTIAGADGTKLLAVSVKYDNALASPRTMELLALERAYWLCQGVQWLLITPNTYNLEVGKSIVKVMPWGMGTEEVTEMANQYCMALKPKIHGASVQRALQLLSDAMGCNQSDASFALWGAVWSGTLPVDLDMRLGSGTLLRILPDKDFYEQNPIAAGRSTWQR